MRQTLRKEAKACFALRRGRIYLVDFSISHAVGVSSIRPIDKWSFNAGPASTNHPKFATASKRAALPNCSVPPPLRLLI
jgi:hypothetical protein